MSSFCHAPENATRESCQQVLARQRERGWVCFVVLALWCGFLFFYGLTAAELYRTENLRAIIAEGMLRSGDWVVPRLYGEPLFTKPPGMYLAIILCSLPLGRVTEFSARLPSALAATVTVFLFYGLFSRFVGRTGGLIAALLLPVSLIYLDKTSAAEIDMLLVAWVIGAVYCFLRVVEGEEEGEREREGEGVGRHHSPLTTFGWWMGVEMCLAGGVLTKWTAPAFFYAMALALLWWRGRLRLLWRWQHVLAAGLGAAVCLSWIGAAVLMTGWETFSSTILREAFPRLVPFYDRHYHTHHNYWIEAVRHPFWILATTLPCSVLALWSLRRSFFQVWDERGRLLLQALHCWVWPNLLFWTLISDHKPRHSFPLAPGLAGLAAMVFLAWWTGKIPLPWPRISPRKALAGLLAAWLAVKLVYVESIMPGRTALAEPRSKGRLVASLVPPGQTLYVLKLKDEGIMFYFGGNVVRVRSWEELPSHTEPVYCILDYSEWLQIGGQRPLEVVQHLNDEQGQPIVLVRGR